MQRTEGLGTARERTEGILSVQYSGIMVGESSGCLHPHEVGTT